MTVAAAIFSRLRDDTVLEPSPSVLEVAIGVEAILWGAAPVPLHLNAPALATWWHFDGPTRVDSAIRGVADTFDETVDRVGPGVRAAAAMLIDAGLLVAPSATPPEHAEPVDLVHAPRTASIDAPAQQWLERRIARRVDLTVGSVDLAVAADTDDVARALSERFTHLLKVDGPPAPVRYLVVDAGGGLDARHWLLSDAGLPLGRASSVDDLLDDLAVYLGEELAVRSGDGVPLRLGVLEARDDCVAVQWDLLASRPMLEQRLSELGYRIAPRQWVTVDPQGGVLPAAPVDAAEGPARSLLPLRGMVLWFGPGSLDEPHTLGEWVWSLVMMGCAGPDHRPMDREGSVASAHQLATTTRLVALTDPGPSALVAVLATLAGGAPS